MRHPLRQSPGVHRDQRRAMRLDQLDQAVVDFLPDLVRHDRLERRAGNFDGEIDFSLMALIDDFTRSRGTQEFRHLLNRLLGRREAEALQLAAANMVKALQREGEMRSAARLQHGVDLVDDHRPRGLQHRARALGGQQEVQRFRGRNQDMRRRAQHRGALVLGGIPAAHRRSDFCSMKIHAFGQGANFTSRLGQVLVDVRRERLQRRDIDDPNFIGQFTFFKTLPEQLVKRGEEGGQRLARSRGGRDQGRAASADRAPAFELCVRRLGKTAGPPALRYGMEFRG